MPESSLERVTACGSCVGCGACSVATDGRIPVILGPTRTYEADLAKATTADLAAGSDVCPFADESPNESAIGASLYPDLPFDARVGRHLAGYAGRNPDPDLVPGSSSGGLTTFVLRQLLEEGLVDGVVHVGATAQQPDGEQPLFEYMASYDSQQLMDRRKSQYYPVSADEVLRQIRGDGRTYAFVGIPCVATAVRHLTRRDPVLREQIKFVVGIVCGHLKSMAYAESFAWQVGIAPKELASVDFRVKDPERTSREYGFAATSTDGRRGEAKTLSLVGGSWGHAVFQLGACDFCDDIFAESADVVFGDAWLARYEIDWRGTNVVLTRNAQIDDILQRGRDQGLIQLDSLSMDNVADTQGGNFRHRREGLAVRLADDQAANRWTPTKRVDPSHDVVSPERRELIRSRRGLTRESHAAFAAAVREGSLAVYLNRMQPLIAAYQARTAMPFRTRLRNKIKRESWRLARKTRTRFSRGDSK